MRVFSIIVAPIVALTLFAWPAAAEEGDRFFVEGDTLVYDTEATPREMDREIGNDDVDAITAILRATPGIAVLRLNSVGGSVWAGTEIARIVQDFGLDTVVDGECSSACVTVFLAGQKRSMTRGSKIGFHQRSWDATSVQDFYDRWQEDEGWTTPFDFGSWIYTDTQTEIHEELTHLVARGVDPLFAIETKRERSDTWFPTRAELEAAGVLRD